MRKDYWLLDISVYFVGVLVICCVVTATVLVVNEGECNRSHKCTGLLRRPNLPVGCHMANA